MGRRPSGYELGAFPRARRESLSPAEAGLPTGPRRRTPGLRRAELTRELTVIAGPAFSGRLGAPGSLRARSGVDRFVHPEAGELRLAYEVLELAETDAQHVVVHLPADEATGAVLDALVGRRPGTLHAVGG